MRKLILKKIQENSEASYENNDFNYSKITSILFPDNTKNIQKVPCVETFLRYTFILYKYTLINMFHLYC